MRFNNTVEVSALALGNFAANSAIGTAAATVDWFAGFYITQTTANITLTLPNPTATAQGKRVNVLNQGTAPFTMHGVIVSVNLIMSYEWDGAAWRAIGVLASDFWRASRVGDAIAALLPDGTTDGTEAIEHQGGVAIGLGLLDVGSAGALAAGLAPFILNAVAPTRITTVAAAAPEAVSRMLRAGTGGIVFDASAEWRLGRYGTAGVNAQSRLDLVLGNGGSHTPDATIMTMLGNGNVGIGTITPVAKLDNNGSTVLRTVAVANLAAGGAIGTAAATVDVASGAVLAQTTAGQTLTIPNPTDATAGRLFNVLNNGTVSVTILGKTVAAGEFLPLVWDGNSWNSSALPVSAVNDFWRSAAGATLPDGTNDTTELISRTGVVVIGSNTQVGTSQLSVVSDTNTITDPIASFQANNLTQGVDIHWNGISKSGTAVNSPISFNAKGTGDILLHASQSGEPSSTGNVGIGTTAPVAKFDNNGSTILRTVAIANLAAGGAIGTAAATVDVASGAVLAQTTAGQALTLPNPTNATAGRLFNVLHNGTVSTLVGGRAIAPGEAITFVWDGNSWDAPAAGLKRFRVVQNLAAGANVINHTLALSSPFMTMVEVRDNATGLLVSHSVTAEATNSTTINVNVALANARITIFG